MFLKDLIAAADVLHRRQPKKGESMNTVTEAENRTTNGAKRVDYLTPPANIRETAEGYVLEAEMPGVNKDGLEITVENHELTLMGRRSWSEPGEVLFRESRPMDFRRVFELDPSIDTSKINAKIEQGVLRLYLPKAESVKPRKITVTD